ncbi:DUF5343 domain-containing protein [Candidatus Tokpelaia sp.]|uniref:DUF5343 domain-containing protein n=1 Tax=Candidatus Tokpelaia sp. TaxID=2233777 RepID=UPI00123A0255|nr:DUF5343 domain-containing protein [Candidatus Tokpelaia sp.]
MASLPYVTSHGNIEKALAGIKSAAVPEKVSLDFVKTILKIPGGSGNQMSTFLKKINFVTSDGSPTNLYKKFRNDSTSGQALAEAVRYAYAPLYVRNEFMHELSDDKLLGLIVEETGLAKDDNPVKLTFACLKDLIKGANFESENIDSLPSMYVPERIEASDFMSRKSTVSSPSANIDLRLGYTINLNLPATADSAVFNAIFKSLKENLLKEDDA